MSTYDVFLDHSSPVFNYYPYGDPWAAPDLTAGWAPWNSVSGGYDPNNNITDASEGKFSHRTQQDGAIVELYFSGSSLTLLGEVENCSFDIWLDGSTSAGTPGDGKLAEFTGLDSSSHRVMMTVHPFFNGSIWFYGAKLGISLDNQIAPYRRENNVDVSYGTKWTADSDERLGEFHKTSQSGASIDVTISQATAITVWGIRGLGYGRYNVTFANETTEHIAKSSFPSLSVLFFASNLDSSRDYELKIVNTENNGQLAISAVNITTITPSAVGSDRGPYLSRGTAIGLITAAVAALIILFCTVGYVYIRRRVRAKAHARRMVQNGYGYSYQRRTFSLARTLSRSGSAGAGGAAGARDAEAATIPEPKKSTSFVQDIRLVIKAQSPYDESYYDPYGRLGHNGPSSLASPRSYGESYFPEGEDDDDMGDSDDESYQFVKRPLLKTPSLHLPDLGPGFQVNFPASRQPSSSSSKRSKSLKNSFKKKNKTKNVDARSDGHTTESGHQQPSPIRQEGSGSSNLPNFIHFNDTSNSTDDHSKPNSGNEAVRGGHTSKVRFSTPQLPPGVLRQASGRGTGRGSTSPGRVARGTYRTSKNTFGEPASPTESIPFTIPTSATPENLDNSPRASHDDPRTSNDESTELLQFARPQPGLRTDVYGYVPTYPTPWREPS
ncbi:hypothetical protein CPB86DRAFT_870411 [Serendipita vermifera]|nr:hypothetical protein CPB86DRAFT_870411 [Serendipita vermifera]